MDKFFEKIIKERLVSFLNTNNILINNQFGFRNKHSTLHALISLTENIRKNLDVGNFSCAVFIDLQKAFDTVDHEILLSKLNHYGVRGVANSWFRSYLTDRKQSVSANGVSSKYIKIKHGVPQGSVLGPLLFLIYINDLSNAILFIIFHVFHFADDTSLLFKFSLKKIKKHLNFDLKFLQNWLNANKIALNALKTEVVLFRHHNKSINYNVRLKLNGVRLSFSPHVIYLGIELDCHLKLNPYVTNLCLKLRRANGALSKLRHFSPLSVLLTVYHSLFFSHINYASQIWGQATSPNISRVLQLQKSAVRIITFSNFRQPSKPLLHQLGVLSISDNVKLQNILLVFQILHNFAPTNICNLFSLSHLNSGYPTRGSLLHLLNKPLVRTTSFGINSIRYQCILNWNFLQSVISQHDLVSLSYYKLKSMVKASLLASYISD